MMRCMFLLLAVFVLVSCGTTPAAPRSAADQSSYASTTVAMPSTALPPMQVSSQSAALARVNPAAAPAQVAELVQNNTTFATDFYHQLTADSEQNIIFSPYSVSLAFSMVYAGARGTTAAHMATVLHYLPQEVHHPAFNALDQQLSADRQPAPNPAATGTPFQLTIANAAWAQRDFPFKERYLNTLAQYYGAGVQEADFVQQRQQATKTMNTWVADQTQNRITDILSPETLSPQTRLVLINAVYFKASWAKGFGGAETQPGPFTLSDGRTVQVPLMHRTGLRTEYAASNEYQAIVLPYVGETVDMLIVLPHAGHFTDVEQQVNGSFFQNIRNQTETHDVTVCMPRFAFETNIALPDIFKRMGLAAPFDPAADFSAMTDAGDVYVSDARHRSTITVDEEGTEAVAATSASMAVSEAKQATMTIDRPFIFAIQDRVTGTVLFLGRVMNPAQ